MAVLVVAIHWMADLSEYIDKYMSYAEEGLACFYFCYRWLVNIAVPTFFLFSGYLLFAKTKLYSWGEYKVKLKSRFHTLFIPYIIWNGISVFLSSFKLLLRGKGWKAFAEDLSGQIFTDPPTAALSIFWISPKYPNEQWPELVPLWFIRVLIVLVIFSPGIYVVFSRNGSIVWQWIKGITFIGFAYALHIYGFWPTWVGVPFDSLLAFTIGAVVALKGVDSVVERHSLFLCLMCLTATCLAVALKVLPVFPYLLGAICLFLLTLGTVKRTNRHTPSCFSRATFFIFCWHSLSVIGGICLISEPLELLSLLPEHPHPLFMVSLLLLPPLLISMLGTGIYVVGEKFFPRYMHVLVGR